MAMSILKSLRMVQNALLRSGAMVFITKYLNNSMEYQIAGQ